MESLLDDYFVTSHQFTRKAHQDQYPAIDTRSEPLSQEGEVFVSTDASQGLGQEV